MNLASTINQMKRIMKYQAENTVSSFFYYMWNAWSEEERKAVYGGMYPHFWEKWCVATDKGTFGAAERFYLELSEDNRRILVERAVSIYDGRHFRKTEAREYLDSEIRYLRELQEADDLREDDMETACLNLGLDLDYREYFINRLAGA